jgi:hypothetical protein
MKREAKSLITAALPIYKQFRTELKFWRERQLLQGHRDNITDAECLEVSIETSIKHMERFCERLEKLAAKAENDEL